ncbi:MAG: lysine--tRNA ligase [Parcubacteria group bacterium RIFCSPHIGHO2_01_FULL_47_10b]|nr:MAG: lysine--tRNA ligase [Parcubacteria group bacterium RIFCSPHIGHO2_01_FULL_47_10b]
MSRLSAIRNERLEKRSALIKKGLPPYPAHTTRDHAISDVLKSFDALASAATEIHVAGRITAIRTHGKVSFIDLEDQSGSIQIVIKSDEYKGVALDDLLLDIGDFIQITGVAFLTKTGQQSIQAKTITMLSKSLRPLPSDWHGFKDKEERLRKRYLDLLTNKDVREAFVKRSRLIAELRRYYYSKDFIEVETPILQTIPGGALAKPFKTKLNALDLDMYLRIAPELYLKRLLVGGFERVFELGRVFRNEGIDADHSPEFTMLEAYWAYQDYEGLMKFIEEMLRSVVTTINGSTTVAFQDFSFDFGGQWKRVAFLELIKEKTGIDYATSTQANLLAKAKELGIDIKTYLSKAKLADEIYKKTCRPFVAGPLFVTDLPWEISPLAKRDDNNPERVERFLLVIAGNEVANGFSELNDPIDQLERFQQQQQESKQGDLETHPYDEDYVEALEYGMPPAAGVGIGIDRLAMLLTGVANLREIILFPPMRPRNHETEIEIEND